MPYLVIKELVISPNLVKLVSDSFSTKFAEPKLVENAYNRVFGTYFIKHTHTICKIATFSTHKQSLLSI